MPSTVAPFMTNVKYFDASTPHGFSQFGFLQFNNLVNAQNTQSQVYAGTHAQRLANYPASNYSDGSLFYETDRQVFYVDVQSVWTYASGIMQEVQAKLPSDLSPPDTGFLFGVTDYAHLLTWTGLGWNWGPGEAGSGMIQPFFSLPSGSGWHICDGSQVNMLQSNGQFQLVKIPAIGKDGAYGNLVSYFRQ